MAYTDAHQALAGAESAVSLVTHTVKPGQVFLPMHDETMNRLTFAAFDPYSRQPAYKACAVRLSLPTSLR